MKLFTVVVFACLATAFAKEEKAEKVQDKRGVGQYTAQTGKYITQTEPTVAYASAKITPQQYAPQKTVSYESQPQYISQGGLRYTQTPDASAYSTGPQQFDYEQQQQVQQVTYLQQPTAKLTASQGGKVYAQAPTQAVHFSPASEVSSFSYSSPIVSYNSLGLLNQASGKLAAASAASQPAPKVVYKEVHQPQPAKANYASNPSAQLFAPSQGQQVTYISAPQARQQPQYTYSTAAAHSAPQAEQYTYVPQAQFAQASSHQGQPQVQYQYIPSSKLSAYLQSTAQQVATQHAGAQQSQYTSAPQVVSQQQHAPTQQYMIAYVPQHVAYGDQHGAQAGHGGQQVTYVPQGSHTQPQIAYAFAPQYSLSSSHKGQALNYA